jgi:hypothetical protein
MRQRRVGVLAVIVAFIVALSAQVSFGESSLSEAVSQKKEQSQRRTRPSTRKPPIDYSRFSHLTEKHRMECKSCHTFPSKNWKEVRKGDDPFPDVTEFPEHQACLNCHRTQFFARERPAPLICSNCHVAVTPKNTVRFPFPSLGEAFLSTKRGQEFVSDFKVAFPHDKHVDVVGSLRSRPLESRSLWFARVVYRDSGSRNAQDAQPKSCPVCHETYQPQGKSTDEFVTKPPKDLPEEAFWLRKGAFKTTPLTHAACSACHNDEAGIAPAPADCAACHKASSPTPSPLRDYDPKLASAMGITDWRMVRKWSRRSDEYTG